LLLMIQVECVSCDAEDQNGDKNHCYHDQSGVPPGSWRYRGYCRPGRRRNRVSALGTVSSAHRDKRVTVQAGHLFRLRRHGVWWRSRWLLR